jgi:hypothetical protein
VGVDEAGHDPRAAQLDHLSASEGRKREPGLDGEDGAAAEEQIAAAQVLGRVDLGV